MNLNKLSDFVVPITCTFSVHLQHHLLPNVNMLHIQESYVAINYGE